MPYFVISLFFVILLINILTTNILKKKTNSIALSIPMWIMLLWLFKGGLDFSLATLYGETLRYESELFSVKVDSTYLAAYFIYFIYYLAYVMLVLIYALLCFNSCRKNNVFEFENNSYLFVFSVLLVSIYALYTIKLYALASNMGVSVYVYSRFETGAIKPILNLVSWLSLIIVSLGVFSEMFRKRIVNVFLLLVIFGCSAVLGNRHILISGIILLFILFFDKGKLGFKEVAKIIATLMVCISLIMSIYLIRETKDILKDDINTEQLSRIVLNSLSSSEFVYSHMSMYGILNADIKPSYGQSFIFLVTATLPRFISDNREKDIYTYYIHSLMNSPPKGFSISNPAGWYLNGGIFFVVIGGALLALTAISLFILGYRTDSRNYLFFILLFALFISDSVGFMRSGGPEPYRAVLLIKCIIPCLLIFFLKKVKLRS